MHMCTSEQEEGQRERWKISSRLCAEHGAQGGARSHDPEITTPDETKSFHRLSHPGAPIMISKKIQVVKEDSESPN